MPNVESGLCLSSGPDVTIPTSSVLAGDAMRLAIAKPEPWAKNLGRRQGRGSRVNDGVGDSPFRGETLSLLDESDVSPGDMASSYRST
jgi:hypothetical protein